MHGLGQWSKGRNAGRTMDGPGRLKSVSDGSARHDYDYAPSGMRVRDKRTGASPRDRRFAYASGGALMTVFDAPDAPAPARRDIVYADGGAIAEIDGAGNVYELHCDHLGSPRHITSGSTGAVVGEQAFGPYGERMVGTFNGKQFPSGYRPATGWTGHIDEDPTGLIYMRGRYYSPLWHRFVSSDWGADPNGLNQFAYVGGAPFTAIDPSGMEWVPRDVWFPYQLSRIGANGETLWTDYGGGWEHYYEWVPDSLGPGLASGPGGLGSGPGGGSGPALGGSGGGSKRPNTPQSVSKTYRSIEQAIKCAFWSMLNDLRANNPGVSLETLLGTGRTEWGGKIFTDGRGGFAYSGYTNWSTDFKSLPGTGIQSIQAPNGMTAIGNYHTHTFPSPEGWRPSNADLTRGTYGIPQSSYIYSAIVTPNRYGSTLLAAYPPNVNPSPDISPEYSEMTIDGKGCK